MPPEIYKPSDIGTIGVEKKEPTMTQQGTNLLKDLTELAKTANSFMENAVKLRNSFQPTKSEAVNIEAKAEKMATQQVQQMQAQQPPMKEEIIKPQQNNPIVSTPKIKINVTDALNELDAMLNNLSVEHQEMKVKDAIESLRGYRSLGVADDYVNDWVMKYVEVKA